MEKYYINSQEEFPRVELVPGQRGKIKYDEIRPNRSVIHHTCMKYNIFLFLHKRLSEYNKHEREALSSREHFSSNEIEELWLKDKECRASLKF